MIHNNVDETLIEIFGTDEERQLLALRDEMVEKCFNKYMKDRGFNEKPLPTAKEMFGHLRNMKERAERNIQKYGISILDDYIEAIETAIKNREYIPVSDKEQIKRAEQYNLVSKSFMHSREYKELEKEIDKLYDDFKFTT